MSDELRARFLRDHPELDAETRDAIRRAPAEVNTATHPFDLDMRPYSPAGYQWSAAEVYAANPDTCRECYTARPYPTGQRHFGWALWRDCTDECRHAHHDGEVWIG